MHVPASECRDLMSRAPSVNVSVAAGFRARGKLLVAPLPRMHSSVPLMFDQAMVDSIELDPCVAARLDSDHS